MAEFVARPLRGVPEEEILSEAAPTTSAELEMLFNLSNEEVQARTEEETERMYRICLGFLRKVGWSNLLSMLHEGRISRGELIAAFRGGARRLIADRPFSNTDRHPGLFQRTCLGPPQSSGITIPTHIMMILC
jgi:hypothetical protein